MPLSDIQKRVIQRCKSDPVFFIESFCKIKHQTLGVLPFKLFGYQRESIRQFLKHRFNIYKKCRQAGISTLTGAYGLWFGMFHNNKTILIVSKRNEDAMAFLNRNIKFPYQNLPVWMKELWALHKENEHELVFPNGSSIKSLTSSPDTLRGMSASLNIIDEAAFMPKMEEMWAGGQQCCSLGTLVATDQGIVSLGDMVKKNYVEPGDFAEIDSRVMTDEGEKEARHIWNNGYSKTKKVATRLGYEIECTEEHRLRVIDDGYSWKHVGDLSSGDVVCLKPDTCSDNTFQFPKINIIPIDAEQTEGDIDVTCGSCWSNLTVPAEIVKGNQNYQKLGLYVCESCEKDEHPFQEPKELDEDLAEIVGFFNGAGMMSEETGNFSILCNPADLDIANHFYEKLRKYNLDPKIQDAYGILEVNVQSRKLVNFFVRHRLELVRRSRKNTILPPAILAGGRKSLSAFLRGLFEASCYMAINDGLGTISVLSESDAQSRQIQVALLSLGIMSHRFVTENNDDDGSSIIYTVRILDGENNKRFIKRIGFISEKKKEMTSRMVVDHCGYVIRHQAVEAFAREALKYNKVPSETRVIKRAVSTKRIKHDYALGLLDKFSALKETTLGQVLSMGLILDEVTDTCVDSTFTADISVPSNKTYIANGFVSHNTMVQGGRGIVISTPKGVGNWYHQNWEDAVIGKNGFNPILINWWNMDWELKFYDSLSKSEMTISPTARMRKCTTDEDKDTYGPYWSPWLEEQMMQLESRGEAHLFRQEILADFIGSGDTVISRKRLLESQETLMDPIAKVNDVEYTHPLTGVKAQLHFGKQLWIWKEPVNFLTEVYRCSQMNRIAPNRAKRMLEDQGIVEASYRPHVYVIGVDTATGESIDYSTIVVIDVTTMEQVAELQARVTVKQLVYMADWIGRYYNNAYMVVESTGIGTATVQSLYDEIGYPNLHKEENIGRVRTKAKKRKLGFNTCSKAQKGLLNKALVDSIGAEGVVIYSYRLHKELLTYVHLPNGKTGAEPTAGNHDDLVIGAGLAFFAIDRAITGGATGLLPFHNIDPGEVHIGNPADLSADFRRMTQEGGAGVLLPISMPSEGETGRTMVENELGQFAKELALEKKQGPAVVPNRAVEVRRKRVVLELRPKRKS